MPQTRKTKAPVTLNAADAPRCVKLDAISMGPLSGWRKTRPGRIDELREAFLGGAFQQSTFGDVCLLRKTDEDERWIIDDGLATTTVLRDLLQAWQARPDGDPTGEPWHQNLVDVFVSGLPVKWLVYEDDGLPLRKLWNIGKHDESNNKFDASSIAQKVEAAHEALRAAAGDAMRAKTDMQHVLGDGAQSNIKRWLRAAAGLHATVVAELQSMPWLPEGFVFDNVFFVGGGVARDRQLAPHFACRALELVKMNRADNEDKLTMTIKVFSDEVCQRIKLVDLWKRHMARKFGAVATDSKAVERLIEHLTTKAGLLKVQECIANNVPCHGAGGSEAGIVECKALYKELERCKAGGLPPPVIQPDLTAAAPPAPAAGSGGVDPSSGGADPANGAERVVALAEESVRFSLGEATEKESDRPDGVSQREYELFLKSKAYMDGVTFADDSHGFKESATKLMQLGRTVHIIDLGTSRKHHISAAIETMGSLVSASEQARVLTLLLYRVDVLADVEKKLKTVLPQWYHVLLTVQGKKNFKPAYDRGGRSYFIYLSIPPCDKLREFPSTIQYSSIPGPGEKLRVLCTNPKCPFRAGVEPSSVDGNFSEIDPDHQDVDLMDIMNGLDLEENETLDDIQAHDLVAQIENLEALAPGTKSKGTFAFPFANTISYYDQLFNELANVSETRGLVLITTAMHPLENPIGPRFIICRSGTSRQAGCPNGLAEILERHEYSYANKNRGPRAPKAFGPPSMALDVPNLRIRKFWLAAQQDILMHPSSWLAARQHNMSVVVWGPRTSVHSQKHGIALATSVRLTRYLAEARKDPSPSVVDSKLQLIEGPRLDALAQVLEPFEVSRADEWFDGLNASIQPAQLRKLLHTLLQSELDKQNLALTEARQTFGRGLMNNRFIGEGEHVLDASCLWYDSKDKLMQFLEANPDEMDRAGCIHSVLRQGKPTTVYFVLIGAAAFVNHFQGLRRTPNVKLVFDVTKGFNSGALYPVVSTRNKQGIGCAEIVMNYGLEFDFAKVHPKTEAYQERFKGPLLKFVSQKEAVAIEVGTSSAAGGGEDPNASVAGGAGPTATQGGGAAPTTTQDTGDKSLQHPSAAVAMSGEGGSENKRPRTGGLHEFTSPWNFAVHFSSTEVKLESRTPENKRLPKFFAFGTWGGGEFVAVDSFAELPSNHYPYDLAGTDLVFDLESNGMMTLAKAMEAHEAKSIFGYKGSGKSLTLADTKYAVKMDEESVTFLNAAKKSSGLVATFAFKFNDKKKALDPFSAGVYLRKMLNVSACDTVLLS